LLSSVRGVDSKVNVMERVSISGVGNGDARTANADSAVVPDQRISNVFFQDQRIRVFVRSALEEDADVHIRVTTQWMNTCV